MCEPATLEVGMTKVDFSCKALKVKGAMILSAWITHKDKGALSLLNVASNSLYAGGTKLLAEALKGNQIMTELNISSNNMTYDGSTFGEMSGVIALADVIPDMGALLVLNLASNNLGGLVLPEGWSCGYHGDYSGGEFYKHADGREVKVGTPEGTTSGAIIIADAIKDMRAMTSLNLASNNLRAAGGKIVAEAIKVTKCTPAIILAPFSCPSDFSINCCCLLLSAEYGGDDEPQSCKQPYLL
jgi:hypothetical protein